MAIAPAPFPTSTVPATASVAGSIREIVPSRLLVTHTDPNAERDSGRAAANIDRCDDLVGLRVDLQHAVAGHVAHPHAPRADRDVGRAGAA